MHLLFGFELGYQDLCYQDYYGIDNQDQLMQSMSKLCVFSQTYLVAAVMIMILLAGFTGAIAVILTTVDIFQSGDMGGGRKVAWLAAMWILLGPIAAAAYYLIEKKDK